MSIAMEGPLLWAERTFGHAELGDVRRTRRLVQMAATAVQRPHAHLTRVFEGTGAMHAAYGFVENDAVDPVAMVDAIGTATARALCGPRTFVVTDGTAIAVTDAAGTKVTGRVGSAAKGGRGDKVHTALALDADGTPIGLLDLPFWRRTGPSKKARRAKLPTAEKETQRWLDAREQSRARLASRDEDAPQTRLHFLHDREADAWPILLDAFERRRTEDSTVRASWDRRLVPESDGEDERPHLRERLASTPVSGGYALQVAAGPKRAARTAAMQVHATAVTLHLRDRRTGEQHAVRLNVVRAREVGTNPRRERPIEWLLYTTRAVETFAQAVEVVREYAYRWRIEEFHRAWKAGGTDAETTQLSGDHRTRWLIILAAVATRAIRLCHRMRAAPESEPTEEFSAREVAAVRALLARRKRQRPEPMTLFAVGCAIASLGGYVRQKSNPHPGPETLIRGLMRLADMILGAEALAK